MVGNYTGINYSSRKREFLGAGGKAVVEWLTSMCEVRVPSQHQKMKEISSKTGVQNWVGFLVSAQCTTTFYESIFIQSTNTDSFAVSLGTGLTVMNNTQFLIHFTLGEKVGKPRK